MTETRHKPGIQEAYRVKRHFKLKLLDTGRARAITDEIRELGGVDTAEFESETRRLDVAYDASKLQFGDLADLLREQGAEPEQGWWARFRASWYRFTDQNIWDNARHEPHCCNRAPPGK